MRTRTAGVVSGHEGEEKRRGADGNKMKMQRKASEYTISPLTDCDDRLRWRAVLSPIVCVCVCVSIFFLSLSLSVCLVVRLCFYCICIYIDIYPYLFNLFASVFVSISLSLSLCLSFRRLWVKWTLTMPFFFPWGLLQDDEVQAQVAARKKDAAFLKDLRKQLAKEQKRAARLEAELAAAGIAATAASGGGHGHRRTASTASSNRVVLSKAPSVDSLASGTDVVSTSSARVRGCSMQQTVADRRGTRCRDAQRRRSCKAKG